MSESKYLVPLERKLPCALAVDVEKASEQWGIESAEEFEALSVQEKLKLWRDTEGEDYPYLMFFEMVNRNGIDAGEAYWFLY